MFAALGVRPPLGREFDDRDVDSSKRVESAGDLSVDDRQAHRRMRSSSKISDAGQILPARADSHDCAKAECRARRSSSVRSSPLSGVAG